MRKKIFNLLIILIIGGLGGVLADQFFLPYLATIPSFSKIEFIRQTRDGTTIINPTEKVIITENTALEQAIDKISPCLVAIQAYQGNVLINQGTGFIVASDGLIITTADLAPARASQYFVLKDGNSLFAQVAKIDLGDNLALLKIEKNNLPVVSLTNLEDLRLGQRIILVGAELIKSHLNPFINLGTIRSINQDVLKINLTEENSLANGSPLVNAKGEVIGMNLIDSQGLVRTIPSNKIKEFINF